MRYFQLSLGRRQDQASFSLYEWDCLLAKLLAIDCSEFGDNLPFIGKYYRSFSFSFLESSAVEEIFKHCPNLKEITVCEDALEKSQILSKANCKNNPATKVTNLRLEFGKTWVDNGEVGENIKDLSIVFEQLSMSDEPGEFKFNISLPSLERLSFECLTSTMLLNPDIFQRLVKLSIVFEFTAHNQIHFFPPIHTLEEIRIHLDVATYHRPDFSFELIFPNPGQLPILKVLKISVYNCIYPTINIFEYQGISNVRYEMVKKLYITGPLEESKQFIESFPDCQALKTDADRFFKYNSSQFTNLELGEAGWEELISCRVFPLITTLTLLESDVLWILSSFPNIKRLLLKEYNDETDFYVAPDVSLNSLEWLYSESNVVSKHIEIVLQGAPNLKGVISSNFEIHQEKFGRKYPQLVFLPKLKF